MKINIIILSVALLILSFCALFENNYFEYAAPIPYSNLKSITLSNFKGLKLPGESLDGMGDFAFIKSNRVVQYIPGQSVTITTLFYPCRSYVFNRDLWNNDLLTHELYHMRITEYCSRLFRQEVAGYKGDITDFLLDDWQLKYHNIERDMQLQYDDDSYHSYVLSQQLKWERKVDSCLQSLIKYSNPLVVLKK